MFIDTHCHLIDNGRPIDNLGDVLTHSAAANVSTMICACADASDIKPAVELATTHDNIYCTVGIHPENLTDNPAAALTDDILGHPRVVGIGEIGLDYHYGADTRNAQIRMFEQQLDIARRANLPVAIHTRDADADTIAILTGDVRGVMHCFTGSWDLAQTMLDRGFFFSASGILTFKNAGDIRDTFAKIPTDRIVIETDAPYCAPVPYRGKTCESAMVVETARVLADIKNLQLDELAGILKTNTTNLYPKCHVK
ncbi:MAG: TatD family hydrolase [Alphaproteobacteria bacterium]|nr:TatD family hydrolase [Alphaproteobacteria bacterium]